MRPFSKFSWHHQLVFIKSIKLQIYFWKYETIISWCTSDASFIFREVEYTDHDKSTAGTLHIYSFFFSLSKVTVFCLRMTHLFGSLLFTPNTHRNLFKMSYDGIEGCSTWRLPSKGQFLNEVARLHSHLLIPHNCIRLCTLYLPYLDSTN